MTDEELSKLARWHAPPEGYGQPGCVLFVNGAVWAKVEPIPRPPELGPPVEFHGVLVGPRFTFTIDGVSKEDAQETIEDVLRGLMTVRERRFRRPPP